MSSDQSTLGRAFDLDTLSATRPSSLWRGSGFAREERDGYSTRRNWSYWNLARGRIGGKATYQRARCW